MENGQHNKPMNPTGKFLTAQEQKKMQAIMDKGLASSKECMKLMPIPEVCARMGARDVAQEASRMWDTIAAKHDVDPAHSSFDPYTFEIMTH